MTDYLEKYQEALREGDEEQANEYYRKYRGQKEVETVEEEKTEDNSEFDPSDHTVEEVKEEVAEYDVDQVEQVLKLEREGKERITLVEYLEDQVE